VFSSPLSVFFFWVIPSKNYVDVCIFSSGGSAVGIVNRLRVGGSGARNPTGGRRAMQKSQTTTFCTVAPTVWNLLHVTHLALRILRWCLEFCKIFYPWTRSFSLQNLQTGSGAHQASYSMGTGFFFLGVKLITHLHLVPRLRMSGAITRLAPILSRHT
jgi:hypothetical protein